MTPPKFVRAWKDTTLSHIAAALCARQLLRSLQAVRNADCESSAFSFLVGFEDKRSRGPWFYFFFLYFFCHAIMTQSTYFSLARCAPWWWWWWWSLVIEPAGYSKLDAEAATASFRLDPAQPHIQPMKEPAGLWRHGSLKFWLSHRFVILPHCVLFFYLFFYCNTNVARARKLSCPILARESLCGEAALDQC